MTLAMLMGVALVFLGGLSMGTGGWPFIVLRKFKVEHWFFVWVLIGIVGLPWFVTLLFCPNALEAFGNIDRSALIRSNLFAAGWGVANMLVGLCIARIGLILTGGILGGLGASLGVTVPMLFKGTGLFQNAPDIGSPAGLVVLAGVAVMLGGVVLMSMSGFGRERILQKTEVKSAGFAGGLVMVIVAGILSTGPNFAFAYSQEPIITAMKAQGAGETAASFAVWAIGMLAGAIVNLVFAAYLVTKSKSWRVLVEGWRELGIAAATGVHFFIGFAALGKGMLLIGALGASVGWGIYQALQIIGGQALGFIRGEWHGVYGAPRTQLYCAIGLLLVASFIMAYGNSLIQQ